MNKRLFEYLKLRTLVILVSVLTSCDAVLFMTYSVENKTDSEIEVFVPSFPSDSIVRLYGNSRDTTLIIQPNEEVVVGIGSKTDFPWGTKNIYKNQPGKCGMKLISTDTIVDLGCTKAEWKFKKRNSKMEVKVNR